MESRRLARFLLILGLLALVGASCGSDDAESSDSVESDDSDATDPDESEDGGAEATEEAGATEEATDEAAEETPTPSPEPELTASYRGVTEDSIKVGFVDIDAEAVLDLGVDLRWGDMEASIQSNVDQLNERGGIFGREIELVYEAVSPIDPIAYDEACVRMTQDQEVFIVLGVVRPADLGLCYTNENDTPLLGKLETGYTPEVVAESELPMMSILTGPWRLVQGAYEAMEQEGAIEGAVIGVNAEQPEVLESVTQDLLDRGAAEVIGTIQTAPSNDQVAVAAELDIFVERWRSADIDALLNLTPNVSPLAAFERHDFAVPYYTTRTDAVLESVYEQGATDEQIALVRAALAANAADLYLEGHEPTVACVDRWNEAHPEQRAVPQPTEEEFDHLVNIVDHCHYIELLEMLFTAAGPELTVPSFVEAVNGLGSYEAAGMPAASLNADKWDVNDTIVLYTWDEDEGALVVTETLDIS